VATRYADTRRTADWPGACVTDSIDEALAIRRFGEELRELRRAAGSPALRAIGERCPSRPSPETLQKLFAGERPPRWELVREVVVALDADEAGWRRRYAELEHTLSELAARGSARRESLLAELGRLIQTHDGAVPTLAAIATGFTPADYVPRPDFDEEFRAALSLTGAPFPLLLVDGDDGAAWRGVEAAVDPAVEVLVPRDGKALADLADRDDVRSVLQIPVLVWADDLSPADLNLLTPERLDRLAEFAVVVATISAANRAELLGADGFAVAKEAFRRAYVLQLDTDTLRVRLDVARSACPPALALVRIAIDARRAGLRRPLTDDILRRLFPFYLTEIAPTDEQYERGLEWAVGSGSPVDALLQPHGRSWDVPEDLVEADSARPIPDHLWAELIDLATPEECDAIGHSARRHHALSYAVEAHRKAATVPQLAWRSHALRAVALREMGELAAAREASTMVYEAARAAGAADEATFVAYQLGTFAKEDGDAATAVEWWDKAARLNAQWSFHAYLALGVHYGVTHQYAKAIEYLDRDFSRADPDLAARAATALAHVRSAHDGLPSAATDVDAQLAPVFARRDAGDLRGALDAFREVAAATGDQRLRAAALHEAGCTAEELGETADARAAYEQSVSCGDKKYSTLAALNLGVLLQGADPAGAVAAWTAAADLGDVTVTSEAALNIGLLHLNANNATDAIAAFKRAEAAGDAHRRAKAALLLAEIHKSLDADPTFVDADYRRAVAAGDDTLSPLAAVALGGRLYARDGATDEAVALLRVGIDSEDVDARAKGAFALGRLMEDRQEIVAAIDAYERAIATGHPDFAIAAESMLGQLYGTLERDDLALTHLRKAYESGHPKHSVEAAYYIGLIHQRDGEFRSAAPMFGHVYESRHQRLSASAGYFLGVALAEDDQLDFALAVWHQIANTDDDQVREWARAKLAEFGE
jgi:tetratricopeptide (TPR) repeat protein